MLDLISNVVILDAIAPALGAGTEDYIITIVELISRTGIVTQISTSTTSHHDHEYEDEDDNYDDEEDDDDGGGADKRIRLQTQKEHSKKNT